MRQPTIALLVPCYNEAAAIADVVADFQRVLPQATIYVYDNNSTDGTAEIARKAGAVVRIERQQGKGAVVRRMFRDIDADFYIMVDGDNTYQPERASHMLELAMTEPCDLVNCTREETESSAYRAGHKLGNRMLTGAVRRIFGDRVQDMLSGYKVFSRRFAKSFPASSIGFGIETELTVHALELDMPVAHTSGSYRGRPPGSQSKLSTYRDGFRILWLIAQLFRHERPLTFFGVIGALLIASSVGLSLPLLTEYLHTGLVPRLPTAILATGVTSLGFLSFAAGLILDTVTRGRREAKALTYLGIPIFDRERGNMAEAAV